jgi:hypothetical protein
LRRGGWGAKTPCGAPVQPRAARPHAGRRLKAALAGAEKAFCNRPRLESDNAERFERTGAARLCANLSEAVVRRVATLKTLCILENQLRREATSSGHHPEVN